MVTDARHDIPVIYTMADKQAKKLSVATREDHAPEPKTEKRSLRSVKKKRSHL
jgi:hypothetical protein